MGGVYNVRDIYKCNLRLVPACLHCACTRNRGTVAGSRPLSASSIICKSPNLKSQISLLLSPVGMSQAITRRTLQTLKAHNYTAAHAKLHCLILLYLCTRYMYVHVCTCMHEQCKSCFIEFSNFSNLLYAHPCMYIHVHAHKHPNTHMHEHIHICTSTHTFLLALQLVLCYHLREWHYLLGGLNRRGGWGGRNFPGAKGRRGRGNGTRIIGWTILEKESNNDVHIRTLSL